MNDQASALRKRLSEGQTKAKTIAVVSGKGGVGKSNTVLNFSIELQKRGKKVLLFDLDVGMGNIDILLGKNTNHTIVDLFNNYLPINDMIEKGPKDLSYIAGGSSLNELFQLDQDKLNYFFKQYQALTHAYDYIFFDMGAGATTSSLPFVLAADECIVVTTPEPTAITDAYSMVKHIFHHQHDMVISVIMNRSNSRKEGEKSLARFAGVVEQFLSKKIQTLGILPNDPIVSTSVIRQTPYVLLNKHAAISKAMQQLASDYDSEAIWNHSNQAPTFLKRLKKLLTVRESL